MGLTWYDYAAIAAALSARRSGAGRLDVTDTQLAEMVRSLPEFDDPADPDADSLAAIHQALILSGGDYFDDGKDDAWV